MKETLNYLPEEYFETKKNGQALYYQPPEEKEEFMRHYDMFFPVRMWVNEVIEGENVQKSRLSVLGVWADSPKTIHFTSDDFEMGDFNE